MQIRSQHQASEQPPSLRGLKFLVAVLGVLVVLGTALVVGVIIRRLYARPVPASIAPPIAAPLPAEPGALQLPPGSRIAGIATAGTEVAVWITGPDGGRVILFDPSHGTARNLVEAPPP